MAALAPGTAGSCTDVLLAVAVILWCAFCSCENPATQPVSLLTLAPGTERVINYGLDKLRYPNAVRAGSRVRAHCVLLKAVAVPSGLQLHIQYTVEVESEAKPACVAEVLLRAYTDSK
eukprot:TRINITY_DN4040_c0_g1_i1.p1 TRINITY_DN4040_c0_g1~~TRINITY_DN4040_c0_g1_i1.p1  ORF type:complete len:118 (+),score=23.42 TRINITY_DN4040_c0_g1_i1:1-354(+)